MRKDFLESDTSAAVTVSAGGCVNVASATASSAAGTAASVVSIVPRDLVHRHMAVNQCIPSVPDFYTFQIRIALCTAVFLSSVALPDSKINTKSCHSS